MIKATLTADKAAVYTEVAKTTEYTGDKMVGDEGAHDRIATTDENQEMLDRFWAEARSAATDRLKCFNLTDRSAPDAYTVDLLLASNWDRELLPSMQASLFSFFVTFVAAKWYRMANKAEAEATAAEAAGFLADIVSKGYYRKMPKVPDWDALEASESDTPEPPTPPPSRPA